MSALRILSGAVFLALALFAFLRFGLRRGSGKDDLGTVSDQWRAEQRASTNDPSY